MKNLFVLVVLFGIVFLCSCSNEITSPSSANSGKLLLKIDRQNAPENVVFVKAYLTRENFDPILGTLNLLSDSTADILLDEINAGTWHLKVDAEDDSGLVLYTGETDVQVFAGFTSQVYLTLQPTGSGTGSIYIYVTWGVPINFSWIDYQNNPILTSSGNYYDYYGVSEPIVIYDGGIYKMWFYADAGSAHTTIGLATSSDGLNWVQYSSNPVLTPGPYGTWDSYMVTPGTVIKEGNIYRIYYNGCSDQYGIWHIGLATSTDGINWEKHPIPILSGTSGWEYQIGASSVIKKDSIYYLYYYGRNLPNYKIGVATSTDGINFTKYPGNPILSNQQNWEANGVLYASVIEQNTQLKMAYGNSNGTGFGFATSSDGLHWTKANNNPFYTNENTSYGWAAGKIAYPNMIKVPNETRIYYSGFNYNDPYLKIGVMRQAHQ